MKGGQGLFRSVTEGSQGFWKGETWRGRFLVTRILSGRQLEGHTSPDPNRRDGDVLHNIWTHVKPAPLVAGKP